MSETYCNESYDKLASLYEFMYSEEGYNLGFAENTDFDDAPNPYRTDLTEDDKRNIVKLSKSSIHYFLKYIMRVTTKRSAYGLFKILPWQKIFIDLMNNDQGTHSMCILGYNKFAHKSTMVYAYAMYQILINPNETVHVFINGDTERAESRIRHLTKCLPKGFLDALNTDPISIQKRFKFFDATIYDTSIHDNTSNTADSKVIAIFDEFPLNDPKMGDIISKCYHEDNTSDAPSVIVTSSIYNDQNVLQRKEYEYGANIARHEPTIYKDGLDRSIYIKNGFTYIDTALVNIMINRHVVLNIRDNEEDNVMTNIISSNKRRNIAGCFEKISEASAVKQIADIDAESVKTMRNDLKLPARATAGSAGYDFYAPIDLELRPGMTLKVPTLIKCRMNEGWVLQVYPRSSLGFKYRVQLDNTVGIIDQDYYNNESNEGHIFIKISMDSYDPDKVCTIKAGEAFAQGIFMQYGITENDSATASRTGGIGSTNKG